MRLLLTSSGVRNTSIQDALVALLDKPIAESTALFIPTGLHPFPGGPGMVWQTITGETPSSPVGLGWKSLGILELTALPAIGKDVWTPAVREADALLVGGGDPLFLADWMRRSGLAELLPSLRPETVYLGVSAGAIAATTTFAETYEPQDGYDGPSVVFTTPRGDLTRTLVTGRGLGLVDFAVIPHLDHPHHADASLANAGRWAAHIPAPTYAIDDQSAIAVADGTTQVVSEGAWHLFNA